MNKVIDYIAMRFAIFMLLLIWFGYLLNSFIWSIILSSALLALFCVIMKIRKNKICEQKYPREKFSRQVSMFGASYALSLYASANNLTYVEKSNKIVDGDTIIVSYFKFSDCGLDDIASAFRLALENSVSKVVFICKGVTRDGLLLSESMPLQFEYIKTNNLYKILKTKNMLPPLLDTNKPAFKILSIKNILDIIFSAGNTKYFIFTGTILAVMSFLTPLKLYYIILASISLLMSVATVIYPKLKDKKL
ncbi:MAG: hypothetical protein RR357_02865 [Clostridia bacterium]